MVGMVKAWQKQMATARRRMRRVMPRAMAHKLEPLSVTEQMMKRHGTGQRAASTDFARGDFVEAWGGRVTSEGVGYH